MQVDPDEENSHRMLIRVAREKGDAQRMARLCRDMVEKCSYSVCVSNTMGSAAKWFARNGHPEEAMEFGQIGAGSYSFRGLEGLAEALAVNGKYDRAKEVYQALTQRYRSGADDRIEFLLHYGTTPEEVSAVPREMMQTRPGTAGQQAAGAADSVLAHAPDKRYYDALGAEILDQIELPRRRILKAMFAMKHRQYEDVLSFAEQLLKGGDDSYHPDARMIRLHALRLLGRDREARQHAESMLKDAEGSRPMLEYVLGKIDAEAFKSRSAGLEPTNHYHFTMGVEAELAGKMDEARAHYAQADTARWQGQVMQFWSRQMAGQGRTDAPEESAPAE